MSAQFKNADKATSLTFEIKIDLFSMELTLAVEAQTVGHAKHNIKTKAEINTKYDN